MRSDDETRKSLFEDSLSFFIITTIQTYISLFVPWWLLALLAQNTHFYLLYYSAHIQHTDSRCVIDIYYLVFFISFTVSAFQSIIIINLIITRSCTRTSAHHPHCVFFLCVNHQHHLLYTQVSNKNFFLLNEASLF